ncbi:MAG: 3-hydroxyacyl-CoA dehydrogenase NAD-binding domain-containing protein [bacterium]
MSAAQTERGAAAAPVLRVEEREGDVLAIVLDRPNERVNLIDERWLEDMTHALERIARERPRGVVLLSAKPGQFIAGADVDLIASLATADEAARRAREGQDLLACLEDLPCPVICAVNGACLGGGLETALACRAIYAADDDGVSLALPEVRLGILPGFGGTWRLPRKIGLTAALPLLLGGKTLRAKQAWRLGLVDRLAAPEILERVALRAASGEAIPHRRRPFARRAADSLLGGNPLGRAVLRARTSAGVREETGGHYPAPGAILDRALAGYGASRASATAGEAAAFGALAVTPEAKNLLFLFRGAERLARWPWTGETAPVDRDLRRGAVVGAGTMGGAIAGLLAERGLSVRLRDVALEPLRAGLANAAAPLNRRVARRALSSRERDAILARISPATDGSGMGRVQLVIEAVPEILELKQRIFRDVEARVPRDAILATNTSSIPIASIAAAAAQPDRVIGLHFFNPVHRMPLVEVIPGEATRPDVLSRTVGLVRRLRKTPLVVADRPGFLVNRLLMPYLNEAALCVEDGWAPAAIDDAMLRFGFPMGPLAVLDEVGLDVCAKVATVLESAFGERARPAAILRWLLERGALGAKAGRGFWLGRGKAKRANVADLPGRPPSAAPPATEIAARLLSGMVNEAARCLDEGVVAHPDHVDLATVLGSGFPPFRGGLVRWARSVGEDELRRGLDALAALHGPRFAPADSLGTLFRKV